MCKLMGSIVVHTCYTLYLPEYKAALHMTTLSVQSSVTRKYLCRTFWSLCVVVWHPSVFRWLIELGK